MDHRKLPTDLISRDWHILSDLLRIADDIQVAARRLYHDYICTFGNVSMNSPSSKTPPARGELVAFAVAEGGAGASGVAEGAVKAAGELGAVGHQDDFV